MKSEKINARALGFSLAIYSGLFMVTLSLLGIAGLAESAVELMKSFHIWFSLSLIGIIVGILEAAVFGFFSGVIIAFFYNKVR